MVSYDTEFSFKGKITCRHCDDVVFEFKPEPDTTIINLEGILGVCQKKLCQKKYIVNEL